MTKSTIAWVVGSIALTAALIFSARWYMTAHTHCRPSARSGDT